MAEQTIEIDEVRVGDQVTVWLNDGNSGQGGKVIELDDEGIAIMAPGERRFSWPWNAVAHLSVDRPLPADECLNFGDDCKGPVELHTTGTSMSAWPRCEHHQDQRERSYENSSERWADSDVPPPWIDRYGTGEQWEND